MERSEEESYENLQRAIAVMTAWLESGKNPGFVSQTAAKVLVEDLESGEPERLTKGLMTLARILLVQLEKRTGREAPEVLQDIARGYRPGI